MQNFSEAQHLAPIRGKGKVYSATGNGKVPFVSTEDIARVAQRLLLDEKPHNTDYVVLGPELLSYDDVSCIFPCLMHWHAGRKPLCTLIPLSDTEMSHNITFTEYRFETPTSDWVIRLPEK